MHRSVLRASLVLAACSPPAAAPTGEAPAPASAPAPAAALPGRIVYLAEDGPKATIAALAPAGGARVDLLSGTGLYPATIAPDGSQLALIRVDERGEDHRERLQLVPLTATGAGAASWTSEPSTQVRNPSWSPDGRFVVFEAAFHGFREIYRLDVPGFALRRLTDNPEGNFEPTVSPDARTIAFVSSRDMNAEVYTMTADGAEQTRLTAFHMDDWGPQFAPDGKTLLFLSNRELVDRVFLMRPDGSDQRRLTPDPTPAPDPDGRLGAEPHETDPAYAPDGSLAFAVRKGLGASLRVADPAGNITVLTDGAASDRSPTWSPDGQHIVFVSSRDGGDLELYRMTRAGAELTRLTDHDGADWLPRWSAR
ncbi:MAG: PD40 domain-containing protein [Myxococcales bacterium]|nr:PD40 domain-containing protein [Myxococcales bacterium]